MPGACFCLKRGAFGLTVMGRHGELPPSDDREVQWRCLDHRKVGILDQDEQDRIRILAVRRALPKMWQAACETGVQSLSLDKMNPEQAAQFLTRIIKAYEDVIEEPPLK